MMKRQILKNEHLLIHILESDIPEQLKGNISMGIEKLIDLLGDYKAKRNLWEVKLKENDDPKKPDFYAIMARLTMLDLMVADLENLKQLLIEI